MAHQIDESKPKYLSQTRFMSGRRIIKTSVTEITDENVVDVLHKALATHDLNRSEIDYLWKYYRGDQPIRNRVKDVRPEICNKITENRANEIVSFKVGYLCGEPIQYVSRNGGEEIVKQINTLNEYMFAEDKAAQDQVSVLKSKRKPSQFEVFHHLNKMRKEVTDLLLRDFGYDLDKAVKKVETTFGGRPYEELSPDEKVRYEKLIEKNTAFAEWFIADERKVIVDCLRNITEEVYVANSIYPTYREELIERRVHQDRAVGQCYRLTQELQYAIETLPVDVNKYLRFAEMIQTEINLLKGWRKSDNKFKSALQEGNL